MFFFAICLFEAFKFGFDDDAVDLDVLDGAAAVVVVDDKYAVDGVELVFVSIFSTLLAIDIDVVRVVAFSCVCVSADFGSVLSICVSIFSFEIDDWSLLYEL